MHPTTRCRTAYYAGPGAVRADAIDGETYRAVCAERDHADRRCAELEAMIADLRTELARLAAGTYQRPVTVYAAE